MVDGTTAYVVGVEHDVVQLIALSAGLAHTWDGIAARWCFAAGDVLPLAAALRSTGRTVRLATGPGPTPETMPGRTPPHA